MTVQHTPITNVVESAPPLVITGIYRHALETLAKEKGYTLHCAYTTIRSGRYREYACTWYIGDYRAQPCTWTPITGGNNRIKELAVEDAASKAMEVLQGWPGRRSK